MKITYVKQTDLKDCGVSCLMSIIKYYGGYVEREYLREITKTTINGVSVYSLVSCASQVGLEAKAIRSNISDLKNETPFIAHTIINNQGHFVVVVNIKDNQIKVMDPNSGFLKYSYKTWQEISTNIYILYKVKNNILKQDKQIPFLKIIYIIFKKEKHIFLTIFILSILYIILSIITSYGIKILLNSQLFIINYLLLFLILIISLKEISNLFRNNLINYLNHSLDLELTKEIYNHIIRLPYLYFKNRTKGDIVTRLKDIFKIREFISQLFVTIIVDLLFIISILSIMFYLNKTIFLIIITISLFYLLISYIYNNICYKRINDLKSSLDVVNNQLIESINSIDTIKGLNIEKYLDNKLHNKLIDNLNNSFILNKNIFHLNFYKNIISSLGIIIVIYILIINNNQDISYIIFYYSLILYYFDPLNNICSLYLLYKESNISFNRINELLSVKCDKLEMNYQSIHKHLYGNIEINNLEYSYNNDYHLLKCKKIIINSGDKVLLYGKSGEGKSTLMKLLVKYFDDYKGNILIDNRDLRSFNLDDIRSKITYVSQDEILYTDTIYNNIVLNRDIKYEKYLKIIDMLGLTQIINNSLLKDNMMLDNNASNLSGGERQRIIIARSIIKNSDIYILDESLNALDLKNERIILEKIFNYLKNKTVIVISHRLNNKDLYGKRILIEKGEVYES